jgi:hypothetical protein
VINLSNVVGEKSSERRGYPIWAAILILIGLFALLANLNILPGLNWDLFWPILIIAIGAWGFYEYSQRKMT